MKKICFVTTTFGTVESFILPLIHCIKNHSQDWDVSIICSHSKDGDLMIPDGVHYYPVEMKRGISLSGVGAFFKIKKILKKNRFDLVQYSTPNASLYTALAARLAGIPVRLYCQWGIVYVGMKGFKRALFKREEKLVCKLSTWVEPDSRRNLEFAHKEGLYPAGKGSVIWNGSSCGVDLNKFDISKKEDYYKRIREAYSIPPGAFVFGFVGRITRDKGINELLEAYRRIRAEYQNAYLILVGRHEVDKTINRELYDWSNSDPGVLYTGYSNAVEEWLSAMDCFVLPSYREGFAMSIIEAEAMGIPAIVTDIPGLADAVLPGETGLLVKKADTDALYAAMKRMLSEAKQYVGKGHAFVKENYERRKLFRYMLEDRETLLKENGAHR